MVQSTAATVDQFVDGITDERAGAIRQLRGLCRKHLPGWEERMQWGMPGYGPAGGDAIVSFNNQKNYVALYCGEAALAEHRGKLKGASFGKGCVRFAKSDGIDFDAVAMILQHVYARRSGPQPA